MFFVFKYIQAQSDITWNTCFFEQGRSIQSGKIIASIALGDVKIDKKFLINLIFFNQIFIETVD